MSLGHFLRKIHGVATSDSDKLNDVTTGEQFSEVTDISGKNSSGSQPARLYGLAKVHKDGIPLRPVLSLPGSCYANINQFISDFFVTSFTENGGRLYEAIDFALAKLYASEHRPKMPKFMVDGKWFVQKDGVAMGASLSVILANLWLKNFENRLKCDQGTMVKHANCLCGICNKKVTYRGYSIQCDSCDLWFHRKCSSLSLNEFRALSEEDPWCCNICLNHKSGCKLFARYVDDIIRTVRSTEVDSFNKVV